MDSKQKIRVTLPIFDEFQVLISHPTGVVYEHQAGGFELVYPEAEGFLVPCWQTAQGSNDRILALARSGDFGDAFRAAVHDGLSVFISPTGRPDDERCHRLEVVDNDPIYGWIAVKAGPWNGWLFWGNDKGVV